jgi:nitrite reductase (NADH) small subunit
MDGFVRVAQATDVPPGGAVTVQVGSQPVALFHVAGKYHATSNTCLHRGGPLGKGVLEGSVITCPLHAWQYDVTTGRCLDVDGLFLEVFEVRVEGDDILVATRGPSKAHS